MNSAELISQDDWNLAEGMTLRCGAESVEAMGLVEWMLSEIPSSPAERPSTTERRRRALRALMADLLKLEAQGLAGYHGMHRKDLSLTVLGFGYDVFVSLKDAMVAAGFLEFQPGRQRWLSFDNFHTGERGPLIQHGGWQARFRLTSKALDEVEAAGIALDRWEDHWSPPPAVQLSVPLIAPTTPLVTLRASKAKTRSGGVARKGHDLAVDMSAPALQPILADLEAHNAFMRSAGVTGSDFIGLRRIFNNGDEAGFAWDKGGRFYSLRAQGMGKAYEALSGDERRKRLRLDGRRVAEVDMRASQLRLLYALLDEPLPAGLSSDLYAIPGVDREAAKAIVTQAIGKESAKARKWGSEASAEYRKRHKARALGTDHPFAEAHAATLAAHPVLEHLGSRDAPTTLSLQFVESEVIRRAMALLRTKQIPSLPVHDSLIVPVEDVKIAEEVLCEAFQVEVGLMIGCPTKHLPSVTVKGL